MWTLLGRAVLFVIIGAQQNNFVYRFFYSLTEWYLQFLRWILPQFLIVHSLFLVQGVLILLLFRFVFYLVFYNLGLLPQGLGDK